MYFFLTRSRPNDTWIHGHMPVSSKVVLCYLCVNFPPLCNALSLGENYSLSCGKPLDVVLIQIIKKWMVQRILSRDPFLRTIHQEFF